MSYIINIGGPTRIIFAIEARSPFIAVSRSVISALEAVPYAGLAGLRGQAVVGMVISLSAGQAVLDRTARAVGIDSSIFGRVGEPVSQG